MRSPSPTHSSSSRHWRDSCFRLASTRKGRATFSKGWSGDRAGEIPGRRCRYGAAAAAAGPVSSTVTSSPNMVTLPRVGFSDSSSSLSSEVLPGARGTGQEVETARLDAEAQILENFGALAIAQSHVENSIKRNSPESGFSHHKAAPKPNRARTASLRSFNRPAVRSPHARARPNQCRHRVSALRDALPGDAGGDRREGAQRAMRALWLFLECQGGCRRPRPKPSLSPNRRRRSRLTRSRRRRTGARRRICAGRSAGTWARRPPPRHAPPP